MEKIKLIDKAIDDLSGQWPALDCCKPYTVIYYVNCRKESELATKVIDGGVEVITKICTYKEFEARKAERQNKPGWKDAPDWAQYLSQNKVGDWWWYPKHESRPVIGAGCFVNKAKDCCEKAGKGEAIGDWQATLEQRPAVIESKTGQAGSAESDWHARGELPPTGTKCLCWFDDGSECWHQCFVIGSIDSEIKNSYLAVSLIGKHERKLVWANEFRPLRTEREKFIDAASKVLSVPSINNNIDASFTLRLAAEALFDAGFRQPDQK